MSKTVFADCWDRRTAVAVALALLVVLSGCSMFSGDDLLGGGDDTQLSEVTGNQTAILQQAGTFSVAIDTQVANGSGTVVENQTIRADRDSGLALSTTDRQITGNTETSLRTESFTAGETTFVRHRAPGVNAYSYEVKRTGSQLAGTRPTNLDAQFDFEHKRTDGGDHLFVADSPDQIANASNGTDDIEELSVRVQVDDESGLVTHLRYNLVLSDDDGTVRYRTNRTITDLGETSVTPPEWLEEAENRTGTDAGDLAAVRAPDDGPETDAGYEPQFSQPPAPVLTDATEMRGRVQVHRQARFSVLNATSGNYDTLEAGPYVQNDQVYGVFSGTKQTFGEDGSRFTALYAFDPATMERTWRYEAPEDHTLHGQPTLANDTVYLVTVGFTEPGTPNPYLLHAVDASTGELQWRTDIGEIPYEDRLLAEVTHGSEPHPVVDRDGLVHVLTVDAGPQKMLALDRETGDLVWEYSGIDAGVEYYDGRIFAGAEKNATNVTVALDASSGDVAWSRAQENQSTRFVVDHADASGVYLAQRSNSSSSVVRSLDPATGDSQWKSILDVKYPELIGSYLDSKRVVFRSSTQTVSGLNTETGRLDWIIRADRPSHWKAQAGATNVYTGHDSEIFAVQPGKWDPESTEMNPSGTWNVYMDDSNPTSKELRQVHEIDGIAYAVDSSGGITAYDAADGTALYEQSISYDVTEIGIHDGTVIFGTPDGELYALAPMNASAAETTGTGATDSSTATSSDGVPGFGVWTAVGSVLLLSIILVRRGAGRQ